MFLLIWCGKKGTESCWQFLPKMYNLNLIKSKEQRNPIWENRQQNKWPVLFKRVKIKREEGEWELQIPVRGWVSQSDERSSIGNGVNGTETALYGDRRELHWWWAEHRVVESLYCTPETNGRLCVNSTLIFLKSLRFFKPERERKTETQRRLKKVGEY